jgi:hypothetical protein
MNAERPRGASGRYGIHAAESIRATWRADALQDIVSSIFVNVYWISKSAALASAQLSSP